ncbi:MULTISPECIES: DUF4132 domain-containing protein [Streptomyces]|uniref:DUF4132 domain-containing protein n=1 Tax=Streptomyces solicathayae TaxID=3081768 RepID=A0ABZ0LSR9_9ACTN|nr:DUF4132 domain-containing protein [Streptomyces sp. HUAS YS2]WOX22541.1 DUF4132 domain-containing protein [Streptomyces sp. HUAS YS2]
MMNAQDVRDRVQEIVDRDNMGELAETLVRIGTIDNNRWSGERAELPALVRGLSEEQRVRLVGAWVARYQRGTDAENVRSVVLTLAGIAGRDLPGDQLSVERLKRIEELRTAYEFYATNELVALARGELDAGRPLPGGFVALLRRCQNSTYLTDKTLQKILGRIEDPVLSPGEPWAEQAMADAPARLLAHLLTATAARPTVAWDKEALALAAEAGGPEAVRDMLARWIGLVGAPRTIELYVREGWTDHNKTYDPYNSVALKGLAWLLSLLPADPAAVRALGRLVEVSLRKVPGIGPHSPKVANAAVLALARTDDEAALGELARLSAKVTFKGTLKQLTAALDAKAAERGVGRAEIEELAVPAFGLTDVGRREVRLGDAHGLLEVQGTKARLTWTNAKGRQVATVPAEVRRDHADALKELKASLKDIEKMLTAQSDRLDRQFLARRSWNFWTWRERILDHPLVGTLARRLIWAVGGETPVLFDGTDLRTLRGDPVCPTRTATVTLWHPVGRPAEEISACRDRLEQLGVTQPFKQAHREVYPLTDAERATATYSNRFAGHVLRQYQLNALAVQRGWTAKLRLAVDDSYPPLYRELPEWGLRAEYWVEGVGGDQDGDLTTSYAYDRVATDQVRFHRLDAEHNWAHAGGGRYTTASDPLPLERIPEQVLTEVLRDVDLFVGVAGVGNDPTWQDGGPGGRHRDYWERYGFGELSQSAETRRELLARLVPRLAIGERCTVEGRFLHVRGALHTYRIHLGSGNVLIAPHDRYLCIVPKSTAKAAVAAGPLPYEGDGMLAIVLSKAMLLADDTSITDPTILSQLG